MNEEIATMWISPSFRDTDFQQPWSIDIKIMIFEDRTLGWKLDIADQLINGKKRPDGSNEVQPINHSGFAALDIVFSYFEMIAKYEDGYDKAESKSRKYFKRGFFSVFPDLKPTRTPGPAPEVQGDTYSIVTYALAIMYEGVRCGLYHAGTANGPVVITGDIQQPMVLDLQSMALIINPHLLIPALKNHFAAYIGRVRDPNNQELRQKFESRFDFDSQPLKLQLAKWIDQE